MTAKNHIFVLLQIESPKHYCKLLKIKGFLRVLSQTRLAVEAVRHKKKEGGWLRSESQTRLAVEAVRPM